MSLEEKGDIENKGKMKENQLNSGVDPSPSVLTTSEERPEFLFGKWVVYACAMVNYCICLSMPLAITTMFIEWQETFQSSRAQTAAVYSTTLSLAYGAAIIPGYLMNRLGARATILTGTVLSSIGCITSCYATSIGYLIASIGVLGGLGFCFSQLPVMPTISTLFDPKYTGVAVSVCSCGLALGTIAFPNLIRYVLRHFSWRETFAFAGGFALHTSVLGLIITSSRKKASVEMKLDVVQSHFLSDEEVKESQNIKLNVYDAQIKLEHDNDCLDQTETDKTSEDCIYNDEAKGCLVSHNEHSEEELPSSKPSHNSMNHDNEHDQIKKGDATVPTLTHTNERTSRSLANRIRRSKWRFLLDPMYYLVVIHFCCCLSLVFAFFLLITDYAQNKGFDGESTGVFFLTIIFITSFIGRLLTGFLNMIPCMHSIIIMGLFGVVASLGLIGLGNATSYTTILAMLVVKGIGAGGIFSIYTKSVLDVDSVDLDTFPLALGTAASVEAISDFLCPIIIGHAVDVTGSYRTVLPLFGGVSLAASILVVVVKTCSTYRTYRRDRSKDGDLL